MSREEFKAVTKLDTIPGFLADAVTGDSLRVYSNGEINYQLKGVNARPIAVSRTADSDGIVERVFPRERLHEALAIADGACALRLRRW